MAWKKGQSGNPAGRKAGVGNRELKELKEAVAKAGKTKRKTIFKHFVERAYKSDNVLIALMKKIVADVKFEERNINIGGQEGNPLILVMFDGTDTKRKVHKRSARSSTKRAKRV